MLLCVAQTKPFKGDITKNINRHRDLITLASENNAELIIFPELSITGYEPELAEELALSENDPQFDLFQGISNATGITICFGLPYKNDTRVSISMLIIEQHQPRKVYSKKYLHSSEEAFFTSGIHFTGLIREKIAPAICYELSVPRHAEDAFKKGATIYAVGVVEDVEGVERAISKLSAIAKKYTMTVLMANCSGPTGTYFGGGKSSAWNNKGELKGQLGADAEGILVYDTVTQTAIPQLPREELVK